MLKYMLIGRHDTNDHNRLEAEDKKTNYGLKSSIFFASFIATTLVATS